MLLHFIEVQQPIGPVLQLVGWHRHSVRQGGACAQMNFEWYLFSCSISRPLEESPQILEPFPLMGQGVLWGSGWVVGWWVWCCGVVGGGCGEVRMLPATVRKKGWVVGVVLWLSPEGKITPKKQQA